MLDTVMLETALAMMPPPEGQEGGPGFLGMLPPMIMMFLIFYFILIRPQQKKQKETQKMIDENPELVQEVVVRLRAAFEKSLNNPKPTMDLILSKSKKVTADIHMNAINLMKEEFLPKDYSKLGCMESARWEELAGQLKQVDVVPSDFDPASSFNLSFLGNCE